MWAGNAWRAALFGVPRGHRAQSALAQLRGILEGELEGIRGAGTWKSERVITSRQGPHIHVDGVSGGILNFCANNYLGLSSHPKVIQAGLQALEEFGAGLSSVRFICGTQKHRLRLVATDGAFSMDGDIAPLQEICRLASRYGALVFVDECHATGFLGPTGRGTDELLGVMDQVTIINSTLGKALGGASGGYTTGPGPLVSLLRQRARPYLFSNSLPPAVVGCASKALDLLMESNTIVQSMAAKTQRFRSKMEAAGFTISGASHPICPVMLGDARLASRMADDMLKRGIFVIGFSYPVVPKGKARIRVQISAVHSEEDIDRCVEAFVEVGQLHGALP
ncbi:2-amino-3-ketobutyrate coenzyme A ligase, mitochondrial isoform X2 [Rhinopithecus roxellana]|uniref:2-amino-3-ketobutyrate coenzyme A ligase, mitochondrial isoform X2 n=1 Tax=Rhinopithecus roxellana TaxID=61622 RepID=UPI00123774BA|nr:2-amino-3-ketobutyrate coenzyme A ligase, mitochondrial isoform X2 [Rhinopithecus roxellana]